MKTCLLFTLGNRDLQFTKNIPSTYDRKWLQTNNEDANTLIIKTDKQGISFWEISKEILENIGEVRQYIVFPMIEETLIDMNKNDTSIIFSTSDQYPNDRQDCKYIAEICKEIFTEKGYEVVICNFNCTPVDMAQMTEFYSNLFNEIKKSYEKIIISNSGGTADMRTATFAAGFFKGFEYISINSRTKKPYYSTFKELENKVLHNTVESMLLVYDFEGIRRLPVDEKAKDIATQAIACYNLDIKNPTQTKKQQYSDEVANALELLIDNMRVCYTQGRYAEALGRIFRIEEEFWYLLFYKFLKNEGAIDTSNPNIVIYLKEGELKRRKIKEFFNFSNTYNLEFLQSSKYAHLLEKRESDTQTYLKTGFDYNPSLPLTGKNWYYFFYKQIEINEDACNFWEVLNLDEKGQAFTHKSKLNGLRNKSYLGHGYEGINQADYDKLINSFGSYESFDKQLRTLISNHSGKEMTKIFDEFSQQIRTVMNIK